MKQLLTKTAIFAAVGTFVYLVLFFFVDRTAVLWIHNHCSETWVPVVGGYISVLAHGPSVNFLNDNLTITQ
jgi:hypothetical protein